MLISGDLRTLIFDCDGVLLDSNRVKTEAFGEVAREFGEAAAEALMEYHVRNGGISRWEKFHYLLKEILRREPEPELVQELSNRFGEVVYSALLEAPVAQGLADLREQTRHARWAIVSGGAQVELRRLFAARGLEGLFDGGIFGSPDTKDAILTREFGSGAWARPGVFFGDSRYDHEAAARAGLDFIFISGWSEFSGWEAYCSHHDLPAVDRLADVLSRDSVLSE